MRTVYLICETQFAGVKICGAVSRLQQQNTQIKLFSETGLCVLENVSDILYESEHFATLMCTVVALSTMFHTDQPFEQIIYHRALECLRINQLLPRKVEESDAHELLMQLVQSLCANLGTTAVYIKQCLTRGDYWRAIIEVADLRCKAMVDMVFVQDPKTDEKVPFVIVCNSTQLTCIGAKLQDLGFDVKFQQN